MQNRSPRIAVFGCGYWGKNLVRNLHELGALAGVCDPTESGRTLAAQIAPQTPIFSSVDDLFSRASVQGVMIATPAETHYAVARQAILAGCDVMVEKPLALYLEDGARLVELAEKHQRILMVGHLLEYHPAIVRLRQLIADSELGTIRYIYSNRLNLGKIRGEENVLWSFAPHDIAVVLRLVGELPLEVATTGGNYVQPNLADVAVTNLLFSNGVRAHIFVSWLHPYKEQRLVVVGSKKMVCFDDVTKELTLFDHCVEWQNCAPVPVAGEAIQVPYGNAEPLREECRAFLDAIATRKRPFTDGRSALDVLEVLCAAQRSLVTHGRPVQLPDRQSPLDLASVPGSLAMPSERNYFLHSTSIVDEPCDIGSGTKIWHFCHISSNVRIGKGCIFGQNCFVAPGVVIGNNVKVQNNVSIYEGVELADDVFCGPSMVFTNITNPRAQIVRRGQYRKTRVGKGATIGANATIVCGHDIGEFAFVAAGAVVTREVPAYALIMGVPGKQVGWMSRYGHRLHFGPSGRARCPESGEEYVLTSDNMIRQVS